MKWEIILLGSAALVFFSLRVLHWSPRRLFESIGIDPVLITAQGFGLGRIPFGPGTFGSLGGLVWFALLLMTAHAWLFVLGIVVSILFSVWVCARGEKILRQKDPGSIVMDEIIAMPICFVFWVWLAAHQNGSLPEPAYFFRAHSPLTVGIFALFRFFDILKPWPVSKSQTLPGGWGVTIDDVLAAGYVNVVCAVLYAAKRLF
jgi:phosphatidylglycerophosphatase A